MGADLERVLSTLLHDLRSPLGVAHGYLRLLHDNRLPTEADRERAIDRTRDALTRMTAICDEATEILGEARPAAPEVAMPLADFVNAIRLHLRARDVALEWATRPDGLRLNLPMVTDHLVDAVAGLLVASARARATSVLHVVTRPDLLTFVAGHDQGPDDDVMLALPLEETASA